MPLTANSFMLGNATPEKIVQLDAALAYLQTNSPNMATPILEAVAENQVRIVFSDPAVNLHDGYSESQHIIVWNPKEGLVVMDSRNNPLGVQSAANGLFHEAVHALDPRQLAQVGVDNAQYRNSSEAAAVIYSDAVAKDCGEIERKNYKGENIDTSNVTAHTGDDGTGRQVWKQTNSLGQEEAGPKYYAGDNAPDFGYRGNEHDNDPGNYPGNEHDNDPGEWTGGGGDGGGGGGSGSGCVAITSLLPDGTRAGDIVVGDIMQLADAVTLEKGSGQVTFSKLTQAPGFRITTEKGVSLVCSDTAPIPTKGGMLVMPANLLDKEVAVRWDEAGSEFLGWETIVSVEPVGIIYVQHITVGDKCFWAGEKAGAYILHHNNKDDRGPDDEGGFYDPLRTGHGNKSATAGSNSHSTAGAAGAGQNLVFASNQTAGHDLQFPVTQAAPQQPAPADHAAVIHDAAVIVGVAPPVIDPIMLM